MKKLDKPRKPSTFDGYIAERSAHNVRLIRQAVSALDPLRFGNLTDYCKAISTVVSEIRSAKSYEPTSPFHKKIVRPLSYVTLLRNTEYRAIVEHRYHEDRPTTVLDEKEDIEDLKLRLASLFGQNNLLKEKIHAIDSGKSVGTRDDGEYQALLAKANRRIGLLLSVYKNFRDSTRGAIRHITEPSEKHPTTGLWAYSGRLMSQEELDEVSEIARDYPMKL
ncbi:hypothetical protein [Pseudomonas putida]|uniref:hypothetical protein n=1 Tax=Pseudomonas putida TaxID=303 RepID=UPI0013B47521|nr:hypothetical protein [Pseudomonas putida]MCI1037993.1 hypothetical protein [Pseudomonas putida]WQE52168.1 hypothetical protein U0028_20125 [Pseudomonas putida]GLO03515.1 hypothetical protein PPUJ13061_34140 [Pseudomonas putida]HDS1005932.1 hypothetical protein [Pseudomonas putida]